jgi:hypothetical protein
MLAISLSKSVRGGDFQTFAWVFPCPFSILEKEFACGLSQDSERPRFFYRPV